MGALARRALLANAVNRHLFVAVGLAFAGKLLVHAAIAILEQPPAHGYLLVGVVYASIAAVVAVVYLPQLWALAVAFAGAALASAAWPELRFLLYAAASFVMLLNLAWAYRTESERDRERASRRGGGAPPG